MGTVSFDFEPSAKELKRYRAYRKAFLIAVSGDLRNINKDLIHILYFIQTKLLPANPSDTSSVKIQRFSPDQSVSLQSLQLSVSPRRFSMSLRR